jgi:hypothetical protein
MVIVNTKIAREAICHNSLLFFQYIRIPILFVTLIITLLLFTLGGQSAFSQCDELCLNEKGVSQAKISSQEVGAGYKESAAFYSQTTMITRLNRDLPVFGVYEVSNEHKSGVFTGERLSISPGLSDLLAFNDRENSGDVMAVNDTEANSSPYTTTTKDWEFIVFPYLWMLGINGKVGVKGRTLNVDASFSDLAKNLDFAAEVHIEVWKRNFGIFVDSTYAALSMSHGVTLQRVPVSINVNLKSYFLLLEVGGLYRVGTWPVGSPYNSFVQKVKPAVTLELLAGVRLWYLKNDLDIKGSSGIISKDVDASEQWQDLFVGGRVGLELIKKLQLVLRSDIGGFGASFSSKISWNIAAYLTYELPWYRITPVIGYRALYDDYENGSGNNRFEWKTWTYGPQIGIGFSF